jgi:lysophospholipid acyltransferase (LPLAT)-like uncharacterized protein
MTPERKARLAGTLGAPLLKGLFATLNFEVTDRSNVLEHLPDRPLLWAFWHNRLLIMTHVFAHYFAPKGRRGATLISQSKDGAIIAAIVEKFGIRPIRGSSSRGGARSLVEMKRAIEEGYIMAITPDGPRGPRYQLSPGVVKLAQITGGFILPIHVTYSSYWRLKSWDGFMIPKPFARVHLTFDVLHQIPPTADETEFEYQRVRLERMLRPQHGE